jgi:hypothetical protein
MDLDIGVFKELDQQNRPLATLKEIMFVEKLLNFKYDMKITKAHHKNLEDKKQELKECPTSTQMNLSSILTFLKLEGL